MSAQTHTEGNDMGLKAVTSQAICGKTKHGAFTGTGNAKGNFAVAICDRPKHTDGQHRDSVTNTEWTA